jgi:aspartokinase
MRLHQIVSMEKGDFLNITIGSNEIGIAISQKYQAELDLILAGEIVLHQKTDLVAVSVLFTGDFLDTPGIIYEAVRKLAWEHINVLEIVTTMNELTFVINREDSSQAYEALQRFL